MTEEYTCDNCHDTFQSEWTDKEAQEEYQQNFGDDYSAGVETAVVCDDCYKMMVG